jgi:hypothetical protein
VSSCVPEVMEEIVEAARWLCLIFTFMLVQVTRLEIFFCIPNVEKSFIRRVLPRDHNGFSKQRSRDSLLVYGPNPLQKVNEIDFADF